jgi:hypothetical protein
MKTNCPQCNKVTESKYSEKEELHYFYCSDCKIGGKGKTEKEAEKEFKKQGDKLTNAIIERPKNKNEFALYVQQHKNKFAENAPLWADKVYTRKMYEQNEKYILSADFKDAWNTPEGQESIVDAFNSANEICATLGQMGDIVPFGKTVEFIPDFQAFNFALTEGDNAPFKRIAVDVLHENDQYDLHSDKEGNFIFEFKKIGFPRGEIIGVIVRGWLSDKDICIGKAYDIKTLMGKAEQHSKGYQYYLKDMSDLRKAQSEGKDYITKWDKKIYEKDIVSPYVGANASEMLSKLAGKSFFRPYMKTRNARAMKSEWQNEPEEKEQTPEELLKPMIDVSNMSDVKDAEIIPEKQNDLFGGEKI